MLVSLQKSTLFLCVILTNLALPIPGQDPSSSNEIKGIGKALEKFVESKEIAGAVTLVIDSNGVAHQNVVGAADIAANRPMTANSIFWIASMSKPITGTCVMMLVDEKKLALSDPIAKYLPELKDLKTSDGQPVSITIQQWDPLESTCRHASLSIL